MSAFTFDTRILERSTRGLERFVVAVPEISASEIVRQVRELAALSKAPNGSQWIPLSKAYAAKKQRIYGNRLANKKATGGLLASVKNRGMIVAPDSAHMIIAQGLERKRISFEVAPSTPALVLAQMQKAFIDAVS